MKKDRNTYHLSRQLRDYLTGPVCFPRVAELIRQGAIPSVRGTFTGEGWRTALEIWEDYQEGSKAERYPGEMGDIKAILQDPSRVDEIEPSRSLQDTDMDPEFSTMLTLHLVPAEYGGSRWQAIHGEAPDDLNEGNRSGPTYIMDANALPIGSKVVVMVPQCPRCDRSWWDAASLWGQECVCGFDWQKWEAEKFKGLSEEG